ncbi:hypothetical protein ACFSKM_16635 [Ancylobacter dichloromethanicus]
MITRPVSGTSFARTPSGEVQSCFSRRAISSISEGEPALGSKNEISRSSGSALGEARVP